ENRYKGLDEEMKKRSEAFNPYRKLFKEYCENNGIITLDQKIDYFAYLKKTVFYDFEPKKKFESKLGKISLGNRLFNKGGIKQKTTVKEEKDLGGLEGDNTHFNFMSLVSKVGGGTNLSKTKFGVDKYIGLLNEIAVKKVDEIAYKNLWEDYEKQINQNIKDFDEFRKIYDNSGKSLDKLRKFLKWIEINKDTIIMRKASLTYDRLYYLIQQRKFDFSQLHHLNLAQNNIGDQGGAAIFSLINACESSVKLNYLNLSYNKLGKMTWEALIQVLKGNTAKIISLAIGGNNMGDKYFSEICIGLSKNSHVNKLFVNDNDLGKTSSVILGTVLKYDKKLKLLDVSKNNINDDNIGSMLRGLICNTNLEILMLNDLGLTNKSLRVFETTLCINTSLRELFLERNKLTKKGWRVLSDIFNKNKYIEYISLLGNQFESEIFDMISDQQRTIKLKVIPKIDYFTMSSNGNENFNYYEYFYEI
ncbi:MAG: hypothetical protein MJ252_13040, partial [archaeon]|nr:hypothetical protein [archaeon]